MPYSAKYVGESLRSLVNDAVTEATSRLAHDIARQGQDTMHRVARESTPSRSGRTKDAWLKHEVAHEDGRYTARISNSDPRALWLNYGTEPHEVGPEHKHAVTTPEGPRRCARVRGITPHFMVERAAMTTEATINETTAAARERWAKEVEAAIEAAKRKRRA